MIKIVDLASLSQVPVVTLRDYDEMDLLKPVRVDAATGYRFIKISCAARGIFFVARGKYILLSDSIYL